MISLESIQTKASISLRDSIDYVGDLINIEGPLLSLYQNKQTKALYIYQWIDFDDHSNRWLIYRISAIAVDKFIKGELSVRQLFNSKSANGFYYTDIMGDDLNYIIHELSSIEGYYTIANETFFDVDDSVSIDKIQYVLREVISPVMESSQVDYENSFIQAFAGIRVFITHQSTYNIDPIKIPQIEILNGEAIESASGFHSLKEQQKNVNKSNRIFAQ